MGAGEFCHNPAFPTTRPEAGDKVNLINLFRNERNPQLFAAGETIFSEGDSGDRLYIVLDGKISLSVGNTVVETIEPGGMFGEMALIDAFKRSATARAERDSRLAAIDENRFNYLVQQTPHFALVVMRTLVKRLRNMDETLN